MFAFFVNIFPAYKFSPYIIFAGGIIVAENNCFQTKTSLFHCQNRMDAESTAYFLHISRNKSVSVKIIRIFGKKAGGDLRR